MGQTIVSKVIDILQGVDIRADEAYPGGRIPALTGAVAAVRLGKVDRSVRTTAVQVVIMSPASGGGSLCENTALRALEALEDMGGSCVKETCKFDEMADVFYIEIGAEFFGAALEDEWSPGPGYEISIGSQPLDYVTSFRAERKTDDEVTSISTAKWQFTMEELLPPGISEPPDPEEPFALTVDKINGSEVFIGCKLTSVKRENTIRGISQIRTGVAQNRNYITVM